MLINKDGKLFGKVSIIDIAVILLILTAAFGVYTRFTVSDQKVSTSAQTIEYRILVRGIRQGSVDALTKGGMLYNESTKEYMGNIIGVESAEATDERTLTSGEIVMARIPDKFDAVVTVQVEGSVNDTGYYTESNRTITVGSTYSLRTKYAQTSGEIVHVGTVE